MLAVHVVCQLPTLSQFNTVAFGERFCLSNAASKKLQNPRQLICLYKPREWRDYQTVARLSNSILQACRSWVDQYWMVLYSLYLEYIGVNFYKAARLKPPPHFLGSKAFRPLSPHFFQLRFLKTKDKITANNKTSLLVGL